MNAETVTSWGGRLFRVIRDEEDAKLTWEDESTPVEDALFAPEDSIRLGKLLIEAGLGILAESGAPGHEAPLLLLRDEGAELLRQVALQQDGAKRA